MGSDRQLTVKVVGELTENLLQLGSCAPAAPQLYWRKITTIDERLERLTERQEALTQSIEIMHHDIEEMTKCEAARDAKYSERFSRLLMENHEHRIGRLEH